MFLLGRSGGGGGGGGDKPYSPITTNEHEKQNDMTLYEYLMFKRGKFASGSGTIAPFVPPPLDLPLDYDTTVDHETRLYFIIFISGHSLISNAKLS